MVLYESLNLIISGVHQSHLGCWGHRSEKVKSRGLDNVACKMCQCAVLLRVPTVRQSQGILSESGKVRENREGQGKVREF